WLRKGRTRVPSGRQALTFSCQTTQIITGGAWHLAYASPAALVLDRKKLAAFSAAAGRFLQFPIGDRRCNRTRASVGNAGGDARPSLTNATLAASRLLHRRSPTAPCSKGALAAHRRKLAAFSALGGNATRVPSFTNAFGAGRIIMGHGIVSMRLMFMIGRIWD